MYVFRWQCSWKKLRCVIYFDSDKADSLSKNYKVLWLTAYYLMCPGGFLRKTWGNTFVVLSLVTFTRTHVTCTRDYIYFNSIPTKQSSSQDRGGGGAWRKVLLRNKGALGLSWKPVISWYVISYSWIVSFPWM